MKRIITLAFITQFLLSTLFGVTQNLPEHELFLFTDRDHCVSGDTIWFKVALNNGASNVVHVQLDSHDNHLITSVVKKSPNGWAEGFLPVPDSLSTGVYFVTAFFNSWQNENGKKFVSNSLFVYNRFDNDLVEMEVPVQTNKWKEQVSESIELTTNKEVYKPREKVFVQPTKNNLAQENLAEVVVSASLVDPLAQEKGGFFVSEVNVTDTSQYFSTEKDGYILTGTIQGENVSNVLVLLSVAREMPYFDYCVTDLKGRFKFFLKEAYGTADIYLQTYTGSEENHTIVLDQKYLLRNQKISLENQIITNEGSEFIETSIDGSYFRRLFRDSYSIPAPEFQLPVRFTHPFYGKPKERVLPSDFIFLENFTEISRELLHGIQFRERAGRTQLRVLNELKGNYFEHEPLRLINGIPIFDNNILKQFNSNEIGYIEYVFKERIFGDMVFKGVVSVSLNDKSNSWLVSQPSIYRFSASFLQPEKDPGYMNFTGEKNSFPDTRRVYFWDLSSVHELQQFEFILSDIKGNVEIAIQGKTPDGKLIKASKIVEVK